MRSWEPVRASAGLSSCPNTAALPISPLQARPNSSTYSLIVPSRQSSPVYQLRSTFVRGTTAANLSLTRSDTYWHFRLPLQLWPSPLLPQPLTPLSHKRFRLHCSRMVRVFDRRILRLRPPFGWLQCQCSAVWLSRRSGSRTERGLYHPLPYHNLPSTSPSSPKPTSAPPYSPAMGKHLRLIATSSVDSSPSHWCVHALRTTLRGLLFPQVSSSSVSSCLWVSVYVLLRSVTLMVSFPLSYSTYLFAYPIPS